MMTIDQAVAILKAERILQGGGCADLDSIPGIAWNDYVKEAGSTIKSDHLLCNTFDDLYLL